MAVIEATEENFDELIQKGYSMVDFYGDHCGACVGTAPFFREAADDMAFINFIKINTSTYPKIAERFHIMGLPTFLYFYNGKQIHRSCGGMNLEGIQEQVANMLYHK